MEWDDWARTLLCQLVRRWGKVCSDLSEDCEVRAEEVNKVYRDEGPPVFSDPGKAVEFLALLDELETCLKDTKNSLTQPCTQMLSTMIYDLRQEIKP